MDKGAENAAKMSIWSPLLSSHTLHYIVWLIAQSLSSTMMTLPPIVVHLGPVKPFPYEQHKIITAFVSPSRTWKQQHSALGCMNLFKCVFLWEKCEQHNAMPHQQSHLFFEQYVVCLYLLAGLTCQSLLDLVCTWIKVLSFRIDPTMFLKAHWPSSSVLPFLLFALTCLFFFPFLSILLL